MARHKITDDQWELIADFFPPRKRTGRKPVDRRQVVNGILWILNTGAPWRDLPEEFGSNKTVWRLFDEWNGSGLLARILQALQAAFADVDALHSELWCIDGTVVRAAKCAAGGGKKGIQRSLATTH